ncbi:MAG: glycosyltransferase family 2 protein [Planctomycetota bacterium]
MSAGAVPLSAVVLTHNEEVNLEASLRNVAGWCKEIVVVDSGSSDKTVEIARRFTDKIFVHPYEDHASQWDWTFRNVPFACDWLLLLDADFIVSAQLRDSIASALRAPKDVVGYFVHHRYVFLGRQIRFGGTKKWWLRLVRRADASVDRSELVDFRVVVAGRTQKLHGLVLEDNKKEYDLDFWIDKHQKFSSRMAVEEVLRRDGVLRWQISPNVFGNSEERISWFKQRWYSLPLYVRPFAYFFLRYIFLAGVLDGWRGFVFHFLQGLWFRLIVDLKMGMIYRRVRGGDLSIEGLADSFLGRKRVTFR